MSEVKIRLAGWQVVVVAVVFVVVVAVRLTTLTDMTNDKELMEHIDTELMTEYAPHVAGKLRAAFDTGNNGKIDEAAKSVTSTKVNIASVKASYPIFDFSIPKDVVVKVEFSLDDDAGAGEKRTVYYLFRHGAFGWSFQYETSAMRYYLNFM